MTITRRKAGSARKALLLRTARPTYSFKHTDTCWQGPPTVLCDCSGVPEALELARFEDDGGLVPDENDSSKRRRP